MLKIYCIDEETLKSAIRQDGYSAALAETIDFSRECILNDGQVLVTFRLNSDTEVIREIFDTFDQVKNWLILFMKGRTYSF